MLRSDGGNRMYSITANRMISGLLRKPLNGFGLLIPVRHEAPLPRSSAFFLTKPLGQHQVQRPPYWALHWAVARSADCRSAGNCRDISALRRLSEAVSTGTRRSTLR